MFSTQQNIYGWLLWYMYKDHLQSNFDSSLGLLSQHNLLLDLTKWFLYIHVSPRSYIFFFFGGGGIFLGFYGIYFDSAKLKDL